MTQRIEDGTLAAYVDGELAAEDAARVEAALAEDEETRERVRMLRETTALLRGAYNETVSEPLPAEVVGLFDRPVGTSASGGASGPRGWRGWIGPALAASLVALFIGLPAGYFMAQQQLEQRIAALEAQHREDRRAMVAAMSEALEKHLSGEAVDWRNPDSGSWMTVTPIRTFKNRDGRWCREYRERSHLAGILRERRAIACRNTQGDWRTRLVTFDQS